MSRFDVFELVFQCRNRRRACVFQSCIVLLNGIVRRFDIFQLMFQCRNRCPARFCHALNIRHESGETGKADPPRSAAFALTSSTSTLALSATHSVNCAVNALRFDDRWAGKFV